MKLHEIDWAVLYAGICSFPAKYIQHAVNFTELKMLSKLVKINKKDGKI